MNGDNLFDGDSAPDLAPGGFSPPAMLSSPPGQMTTSALSMEGSVSLQEFRAHWNLVATLRKVSWPMNDCFAPISSPVVASNLRMANLCGGNFEGAQRTPFHVQLLDCISTASTNCQRRWIYQESLSCAETLACLFGRRRMLPLALLFHRKPIRTISGVFGIN